MWRSTHLVFIQDSLVSRLPVLLDLPPTNLEWAAFFFTLSLPSICRGRCMNQHILNKWNKATVVMSIASWELCKDFVVTIKTTHASQQWLIFPSLWLFSKTRDGSGNHRYSEDILNNCRGRSPGQRLFDAWLTHYWRSCFPEDPGFNTITSGIQDNTAENAGRGGDGRNFRFS